MEFRVEKRPAMPIYGLEFITNTCDSPGSILDFWKQCRADGRLEALLRSTGGMGSLSGCVGHRELTPEERDAHAPTPEQLEAMAASPPPGMELAAPEDKYWVYPYLLFTPRTPSSQTGGFVTAELPAADWLVVQGNPHPADGSPGQIGELIGAAYGAAFRHGFMAESQLTLEQYILLDDTQYEELWMRIAPSREARFQSLAAQQLHPFRAWYPPFSMQDCRSPEKSRRALYGFFRELIDRMAAAPARFGISDAPGFALSGAELEPVSRPFLAFFQLLWLLGRKGQVGEDGALLLSDSAAAKALRARARLEAAGLVLDERDGGAALTCPAHPALAEAWRELACLGAADKAEHKELLRFTLCRRPDVPFRLRIRDWFGETAAHAEIALDLEEFLPGLGYAPVDTDLPFQTCWRKNYPGRVRGQVNIGFDRLTHNPELSYGFFVPAFPEILSRAAEWDRELTVYLLTHTKPCDGCRYCVQLDKTGKRPLATRKIDFEGRRYARCPYFPSLYNGTVDGEQAAWWKRLLALGDRLARERA